MTDNNDTEPIDIQPFYDACDKWADAHPHACWTDADLQSALYALEHHLENGKPLSFYSPIEE